MSNSQIVPAVRAALSPARMKTFEIAAGISTPDNPDALELYAWNAQLAAAMLAPLHICEVVLRNAVSDAIEAVYGARWPWSIGFEQSLPAVKGGYNPQRDLQNARSHATTTGKVIPELKFVFWQKMFTSRHDARLWNPLLRSVMPNVNPNIMVAECRAQIFDELEHIRTLRNRIAHHEPIFARDLRRDLARIHTLIELRCKITADWMMRNQMAANLIGQRP